MLVTRREQMQRLLVVYGRKEPVDLSQLDDATLEQAVVELRMRILVGTCDDLQHSQHVYYLCAVCAQRH